MSQSSLTKSAQTGDAYSCYQLALMFHKGTGIAVDLKQAARWYRKAAEFGLAKAQVQLANMYLRGEGLPAQSDKACYWFEKAADQGDSESCQQLFLFYAEGIGVNVDLDKSLAWYKKAFAPDIQLNYETPVELFSRLADSGDAALQMQLAALFESNKLPGGFTNTYKWYQSAAINGSIEAIEAMSRTARANHITDVDTLRELIISNQEAAPHLAWELAVIDLEIFGDCTALDRVIAGANHGIPGCMAALGHGYLKGLHGLPVDRTNAKMWLTAASSKGDAQASFYFAQMLLDADKDDEQALALLVALAENGHVQSMSLLGSLAQDHSRHWLQQAATAGDGDSQFMLFKKLEAEFDLKSGMTWLERAAASGHAEAQYQLSTMLLAAQDFERGSRLLHASAESGWVAAQLRLAELYESGIGVEQDPQAAILFTIMAAENGSEIAQFNLATTSKNLLGELATEEVINKDWLALAAQGGHPEAQTLLGKQLLEQSRDRLDKQLEEEAITWLTRAADKFARDAAAELADFYNGVGDKERSWHYLNIASEQIATERAYELGCEILANADDGSEIEAVRYFKLAAERGHGPAQFELAVLTACGIEGKSDYAGAAAMFELAAGNGVTEAQYRLAMMQMAGIGCSINHESAAGWLYEAAQNGHCAAMVALSRLLETQSRTVEAIEWMNKAAALGSPEAALYLAPMFAEGTGIAQDLEKAYAFFRLAAEELPEAAEMLQGYFSKPFEEYESAETALFWYQKGCENLNAPAIFNLAEFHFYGKLDRQDTEQAVSLYLRAAELGYASAQLQLSDCFYLGEGVNQDLAKATYWCEKAADSGNVQAQFTLATAYESGEGVDIDSVKAIELYRKAAAGDHALAQLHLATLLAEDAESVQEAVHWYKRAATQGAAEAYYQLAKLCIQKYDQTADLDPISLCRQAANLQHNEATIELALLLLEKGDRQSTDEAISILEQASNNGNADAYYHLGQLAYQGLGIPRDLALAANYYLRATELGSAKAPFLLALMYMNGHGVNESYQKSMEFCKISAEREHTDAQYYLGLMYLTGDGCERDPLSAQRWLRQAANGNCIEAGLVLTKAYLQGMQLDVKEADAISWCQRGITAGNAEAANLMANFIVQDTA